MTVKNFYGVEVEFEAAVNLMNDEIREELHGEYDNEQEFFDAYCEAHEAKFGEEFELAKENPCY